VLTARARAHRVIAVAADPAAPAQPADSTAPHVRPDA
jgi:hypothetical protein